MDQLGIAIVTAVVNSIHAPAVISFHCESVLEFGDEFLQFPGLLGIQNWHGNLYHMLQLLTAAKSVASS
jgi:hypothetical protein